jgi:hypothetical protein
MLCEERYAEKVKEYVQGAEGVENQWKSMSEENEQLCETVPTVAVPNTDYHAMGWKREQKYFNHGWPTQCDRCKATQVAFAQVVAGCRMNGDGYGSDLHFCNVCGLFDWSSYDEHD